MAIQRTDTNTGIYNQFSFSSGENLKDMAAVMNMLTNVQNRSVLNFIDDAESEVNRLLADPKSMDTQKNDAKLVKGWAATVRKFQLDGVPIEALAAVYHMGRVAERLGIRPFEPLVIDGKRHAPLKEAGRESGRRKGEKYSAFYPAIQQKIDEVRKRSPHLSHTAACKHVQENAGKYGYKVDGKPISLSAILNNTINRKPNKEKSHR